MIKWLTVNWPGLILGMLVGILMVFPAFYFRHYDGAYKGIDYFGASNEDFYLTQIQEIYDGHWSLGNIYLAEGKDDYYVQPPLAPIVVAFLGKLLGLSARGVNLLTKFLFPAVLTFVVYKLFLNLIGRRDLSILMAVFVMLLQATWIFLNPAAWLPFLLKGEFVGTNYEFISYARPINPQISSILFFSYLLCIWKFLFTRLSEKLEKIYGIAGAIIFGLSFYVYFYTYSFLFVLNGILAIWFLYSRDWKKIKRIIWVSLGALTVATPYFINFFGASKSPFYAQLTQRLAVLNTHQFIFSRVWFGVTAIFLLLYKKFDSFKLFMLAFLATAFVVTNQQVITGKTAPMLAHFHWYYISPVAGALLIYIFFVYFEKIVSVLLSRAVMILLFLLFLSAGILYQKNSYAAQRETFVFLQRYAPVISWLDKNIKEERTVFANENLAAWIPAYTSQNIYFGGVVHNFLISQDYFKHNFYIYQFLNGVTKENLKKFFYENRDLVGGAIFDQYYREKNGCYGCFPDSILDQLIIEYQVFLNKDFIDELKKYPLDYVVWDKEKNPSWKMDRFFNQKLYEKDNLIIYLVS